VNDYSSAALVIAGHGSTRSPDAGAPTLAHAEAIRKMSLFAEVAGCFWKQAPAFRDVLRLVESREIFVVPNFISEGYFTRTVIPREMELDGPVTRRDGRVIRYCEPVGNHPHMTKLLMREAKEIAPDVPPQEISLLLVGHGTGLDDNSAEAVRRQVRAIAATGEYAEVLAAYLEEPPFIAEWDLLTTRPHVVVVPFFISAGPHSSRDIPALLGIPTENGSAAGRAEGFRHNPHELRGRLLSYGRAIGTAPGFANLLLDQVKACPAS